MYACIKNKQKIKYWLTKYANPKPKARRERVATPVPTIANGVCTSA